MGGPHGVVQPSLDQVVVSHVPAST
jgi:hypothetical protein